MMSSQKAAIRWTISFSLATLFVGCSGQDAVAPERRPSLTPSVPAFNAFTTDGGATQLTAYSVTPSNHTTYNNSYEYELRFSFVGYTDAHMEPRVGAYLPLPPANERTMPVRIRTGSSDHIHVEICARSYDYLVYIGCFGSGSADFYAADNAVAKNVSFTGDWHTPNSDASFALTLQWTPVDVHPSVVYVSTPNPELFAGGPSQELFGSAADASGQMIPGLNIGWSSSNTSIFTVNSTGVVTPIGAGTATLTATVFGVSGSMSIVVYAVQPLTMDIVGPSTVDPGWEATWSSNARGGIPPYTYVWRVDGTIMQQGQGPDYAYFAYTNQGTDFTVNVNVIDYRGMAVGKSIGVTVASSCTPNCY